MSPSFPLRLNQKLYLGAAIEYVNPVGIGRWILPDSDRSLGGLERKPWPSSLFIVFQTPEANGNRLIPLAVFSMDWRTTGVKSIHAHEDSAE